MILIFKCAYDYLYNGLLPLYYMYQKSKFENHIKLGP